MNASRVALPARHRDVVAAGSLTETGPPWDRPQPDRRQGRRAVLADARRRRNATVRLGAAPQPTDQRMKPVYGTSLATARYTGYLARCLSSQPQRTREGHGHIESEPARRIRTPTLAYQHTQPPPDGADATNWGRGTLRTRRYLQTRPGEHVTVNGGVSPLESVIVARRDPGPLAGLERQVSID
jgi:hypothetical protein